VVQLIQPRQHGAFDDRAEQAHDQRRRDQRQPIVDAAHRQQQQRREGTQHVLRAMREVDHAQQAEDDGQAQRQQRIE
jgi:hypothetical protein